MSVAEWFVRAGGRVFGPMDEQTARDRAAAAQADGWLPTLLCREDPATNPRPVGLAEGSTLAERLVPTRTRPYSSWRR